MRIVIDWADALADQSLRWPHRSFCWFCHMVAHILIVKHFNVSTSRLPTALHHGWHYISDAGKGTYGAWQPWGPCMAMPWIGAGMRLREKRCISPVDKTTSVGCDCRDVSKEGQACTTGRILKKIAILRNNLNRSMTKQTK